MRLRVFEKRRLPDFQISRPTDKKRFSKQVGVSPTCSVRTRRVSRNEDYQTFRLPDIQTTRQPDNDFIKQVGVSPTCSFPLRFSTCKILLKRVNLLRMTTKNYLSLLILLFIGIALSCNKGEFDPNKCVKKCPDLMTCYDGVCDCDTGIAFKMWDKCHSPEPNRYVNFKGDSALKMTGLILDSSSYSPNSDWYTYLLYYNNDDVNAFGYFDATHSPSDFSTKVIPKQGYDSLYMRAFSHFYYRNGIGYDWQILGKRYGTDSMEIRIFISDLKIHTDKDSSSLITLRRL